MLPVTLFRYPARVVPLAALGICALAAFGCDFAIRRTRWQFVIAALMFADVVSQIQPLLATAPFSPHRVPYPPAIGRDGKIVRVGQKENFAPDSWISGYLNLYDRRFDATTAAPILSQRYDAMYQSMLARGDMGGLRSISAGYVIAPAALTAFQPLFGDRGAVVHRNRGAFPLAYVRDDVTYQISSVKMLAFTPSAVFIDVDMASGGDVVVTQQAAPGWRVTVDEKAATPHETSLFRGVHVPPGRHAVKWIYRPVPLMMGALITFAALLRVLFSRIFVKRSDRKNFLRPSPKIA
jgi:hypothetical protein